MNGLHQRLRAIPRAATIRMAAARWRSCANFHAPCSRIVAATLAGAMIVHAGLVSAQSVPSTDGRTDGRTEGRTEGLTEAVAVRLALDRPALRDLVQGTVGIAEGDLIEAQTLPNPQVGFEREGTSGVPNNVVERTASLSQRFDFSGRRALRTEAASARVEAAQADAQTQRRQLAFDTRRRFHEALALQATRAALSQWIDRLEAAEKLAGTLQKGGEVAGYDRRRIERERLTVDARVQALEADLARGRERLAAVIGTSLPSGQALAGALLPDDPRPLADLLTAARDRSELRSVERRGESFRREAQAAERGWIPNLTLGAGLRHIDSGARTDSGIVLSIALPLPLFDRSEGRRRRASAQAEVAAAQLVLERERIEGDVRGLWQQTRQLNDAARRFSSAALDASQRLVQIAEAAYRGGETTILDLLDAHRGRAEADTRAIELELAARLARLELDFLSGEPNP